MYLNASMYILLIHMLVCSHLSNQISKFSSQNHTKICKLEDKELTNINIHNNNSLIKFGTQHMGKKSYNMYYSFHHNSLKASYHMIQSNLYMDKYIYYKKLSTNMLDCPNSKFLHKIMVYFSTYLLNLPKKDNQLNHLD